MAATGTWADATAAELSHLYKLVCLAPTLDILEALLRGEKVPAHRLDREQVRRFHRRR